MVAQGVLPYKLEVDTHNTSLTGLAGLPIYLDLAHVVRLRDAITEHVQVRSGSQGWTDAQMVTALILLNLAGGQCVEDLEKLETDRGFALTLHRVETFGMKRSERRGLERRWRKSKQRTVPSASAMRRYLAAFHDAAQEALREPGTAFIPSPGSALDGLSKVNEILVAFLQRHSGEAAATLDMDATLIETQKKEALPCLSSTLQGETADKVFSSLKGIGVALEGPEEAPLTAMVLKERQLDLDIVAAQDREAFYDRTLALLEEQEAAYRDELAFLGQAELRRLELVDEGCLSSVTHEDTDYVKGLFNAEDPKMVQCKGLVYRLLVQYSAAWSLGRVKSEQIDYRLIALHHTSALDTSDIAFQKWTSLLGPPIDQLVAFSKTGLRPEDIVTPIVNVFGLGAIAAGVN